MTIRIVLTTRSARSLAIEMGADGTDIGKRVQRHPTLGESIGMAAEVYEGLCTNLASVRKR